MAEAIQDENHGGDAEDLRGVGGTQTLDWEVNQ